MTVLIVLEGMINHYIRGREQNLADSVTSITSGLLMTMAGMLTRLFMIQVTLKFITMFDIVLCRLMITSTKSTG